MKALFMSALVLSSASVVAAENDNFKAEGKVAELQAVVERDTALRVTLEKAPPLCGNTWTYAYIGEKDDNFKGTLELLQLAKSTKAPVMLVSRRDGQGYCKLLSVTVR